MVNTGSCAGGVHNLIALDNNLERFLLCSPFSTNDAFNYSSELTDEIFFNQLYVSGGNREQELCSEILEIAEFNRKQSIFLLGNKGCGKTTFVHKIIQLVERKPGLRNICLDFGDSSATLTLKKGKERLIQSIYKSFREIARNNEIGLLQSFVNTYFKNEEDFDVAWDFNGNLYTFYETFRIIISDSSKDLSTRLKRELRPLMAKLEIFQLFLIFVLFDLEKQQFSNQKQTLVVFDNLDNLIDISDISQFIENFCNFQNNIGTLLKAILQREKTRLSYIFIFVMREITKANISAHALETMRISSKEYDITTLYPKKDIIIKRISWFREYLVRQTSLSNDAYNKAKQQIDFISQIISDPYMHQTIFPFYNNDYRICVMKLVEICGKRSNLIKQYIDLIAQNSEDAKFGGRGIVYRIILSDLQTKGYFARLMIVDFTTRDRRTSLARLLLTYLANTTESDCTDGTPSVSLKELFKAFKDIKPSEITGCLWAMFDLITTNDWNPLITFASSKSANKERLYEEKNIYRRNNIKDSDKEYSRFRITCAGEVYLRNVCTHYEFFSCRALGDSYLPLFCVENLNIINDKYIFENIVDAVYNQVYRCCLDLSRSFESERGVCNEARPPYNYKNGAIYQYHSERIVFSHIGYLDSFRCYLIKAHKNSTTEEFDIEKASTILLKAIRKYCELICSEKVARCAATKRFSEIIANLEEAERFPCDLTKTINRKR